MGLTLFLSEYIVWHYGKALSEILSLGKNLLRFGYHFFSLPLLMRTWISPWYRMREEHDRNLTNFESLGAAIFGNLLLRFIGFLLRTCVITMGILFEIGVLLFLVLLGIVWILFPIIIFVLLTSAVSALL